MSFFHSPLSTKKKSQKDCPDNKTEKGKNNLIKGEKEKKKKRNNEPQEVF